jgi:hypothetical protein
MPCFATAFAQGWQLPGIAIIDGAFIPAPHDVVAAAASGDGLRAALAAADLSSIDVSDAPVFCRRVVCVLCALWRTFGTLFAHAALADNTAAAGPKLRV